MIVDVYNEIFTKLKTEIPDVDVLPEFADETPSFPCVTLEEITNVTDVNSVDSGGEKFNIIGFDINIFDNSQKKRSVVREMLSQVDDIMSGQYNMTRTSSQAVPNYLDLSIYRYNIRYTCKINENHEIYRG